MLGILEEVGLAIDYNRIEGRESLLSLAQIVPIPLHPHLLAAQ
jgi:hypothetical protein